jgi:hypothetical protein
MSAGGLREFEGELRTLIRSRHGIAVCLTYSQVRRVLKAVNLPSGDAFMRKMRNVGLLQTLSPTRGVGHARYGVEDVVRMVMKLHGG